MKVALSMALGAVREVVEAPTVEVVYELVVDDVVCDVVVLNVVVCDCPAVL